MATKRKQVGKLHKTMNLFSLDQRMAETVFAVEATHTESFLLWKLHTQADKDIQSWEADALGWNFEIGTFGGAPVNLALRWAKIEGRWVLFYESGSRVVDWELVERWMDREFFSRFKNDGPEARRRQCNAANFHQCLNFIRRLNEEKAA